MARNFDLTWLNINNLQGQTFNTKKGLPFTYKVKGNAVWVTRNNHVVNQKLNSGDFELVYNLMEKDNDVQPGNINKLAAKEGSSWVRGPSYVWAILNDPRI